MNRLRKWALVLACCVAAAIAVILAVVLITPRVPESETRSSLGVAPVPVKQGLSSAPSQSQSKSTIADEYHGDIQAGTDDLLDALLSASRAEDQEALRRIVFALEGRDTVAVGERAAERLAALRRNGGEGSGPELSSSSAWLYSTVLVRLVLPFDPQLAFAEIRTRWSRPMLEPERREDWAKLNRMPMERVAEEALPPEDRIVANGVANALVTLLVERPERALLAIEHVSEVVDSFTPQDEVPDPWLSLILQMFSSRLEQHSDMMDNNLRGLLTAIVKQHNLSERLRLQASLLLMDAPEDFWHLLEMVSGARTEHEAAEALGKYLESGSLSDNELRMLLRWLQLRFLTTVDGGFTFMEHLSQIVSDPRQVLELTSSMLLLVAFDEAQDEQWLQVVYFAPAIWNAKSKAKHGEKITYGVLSESTRGEIRLAIDSLWQRTARNSELSDDVRNMTYSRLLDLMWRLPDERYAILDLLREKMSSFTSINNGQLNAILNGLTFALKADELSLHRQSVIALLNTCIPISPLSKEPQRPLRFTAQAAIQVGFVATILERVQYPTMEPETIRVLLKYATAVMEDGSEWPSSVGALRPGQLRQDASKLLEVYSGHD